MFRSTILPWMLVGVAALALAGLVWQRGTPKRVERVRTESAEQTATNIPTDTATKTVRLFYYNPALDVDASSSMTLCSEKGLVAVERDVPADNVTKNTINLLLEGTLTPDEKARGITTEYPLDGFTLKDAEQEDDVLTLTFDDPKNKTSGGSCRITILWKQIEATARQFDGINDVKFLPETLFQP